MDRSGLDGVAGIREIRGQGLLIGVGLDQPCTDLVQKGLDPEADELTSGMVGLIRDHAAASSDGLRDRRPDPNEGNCP